MGKGDRKTRKGKITKKSFGKTRPHKTVQKKQAEQQASA
ncbi:30S ribosomal protein THX [Mucilaginibacter sp. Bleaf8]|nr:30S ribosomal protein THX [Mucilaginibacter sp. Bleaf8]MBS7565018.1 30S ribosomal protein THX [Mucilaginibacter sp. Bleaf8]